MYCEVYEPKESNLTITIPDEFIGKRVVVEIKNSEESKIDRIKKLEQSLVGYKVDLSNFKFNRDVANNFK